MRPDIFDYIQRGRGSDRAFQRLSARRQLGVFSYDGFWQAMDTFKDKMAFDRMHARGECPWMLWKQNGLEEQKTAPRSRAGAADTANVLADVKVFSRHQRPSA
jgi:NDP-sugar pyrophosphorylase family protein